MEKATKKKNSYSAISIKTAIAIQFRRYSKTFAKSNSEVLRQMMVFLKWNELNPFDNSLDKLVKLQEKQLKRIDYLISIIKDNEKRYSKPTYEMVKILFEAYVKQKDDPNIIKKSSIKDLLRDEVKTVPQGLYQTVRNELNIYQKECKKLLENVVVEESHSGQKYLKIELSFEAFQTIKKTLKT